MRIILFILSLCFLSLTTPVKETAKVVRGVSKNLRPYFATYYLSPSGSDAAAGGIGTPWFTLEKAWDNLAAGDLLYLRGGTYQYLNDQYLDALNGTSGNLIKIWNYPGENPIITAHSSYDIPGGQQDLIYLEGNYFHFKGIEIAYFAQVEGENGWSAFRCGFTNNSIFELLNYHDNASAFKIAGNSTNNLILNCDFYRNQDPYSGEAYGGADGINVGISGSNAGNTTTIRGCRAFDNSDDGFDCWRNEGYVLLDSNWAFHNGYIPGTNTTGGDGGGYKLGETESSYFATLKRTLQNSIAWGNRKYGIVENDLKALSNVYNNTVIGHADFGFYYGQWNPLAIGTLTNNVSYLNDDELIGAPCVETTNSWQGFTLTSADFLSLDEAALRAPRKPDGSLPDIFLHHLAPGSDLVRGGTEVGLGTDLGFFGYQGRFTPLRIGQVNNRNVTILQQ